MRRQSAAAQLYARLRAHPQNVSFLEAVRLARLVGFEELRTSGSHHIFGHRRHRWLMLNLQERRGEAKPYQVRQLVTLIEDHDLLEDGWRSDIP